MISAKKEKTRERLQQKLDAGSVSNSFPEVTNIIISMMYKQRGTKALLRTVNFSPDSYAFFRVDCLSRDCADGGFDLSQVINTMVRNRRETGTGELGCEANDPAYTHSDISYDVAIKYN